MVSFLESLMQQAPRSIKFSSTGLAVTAGVSAAVVLPLLKSYNHRRSVAKINNYTTDNTWDWSKEIVVVTGGSSGIGSKIVARLAADNIKTIVLDRQAPDDTSGAHVYYYQVDLVSSESITAVAERIRKEHGDPTVLINNAGTGSPGPCLEVAEQTWRTTIEVNLFAPMLLSFAFLPSMIKRNHGHIINISSMSAFLTQASNVFYASSKVGLLAFHEGLLQELRLIYNAPAVRASIVHPSWVATPLIRSLIQSGKLTSPITSPETVADLIVQQLYRAESTQIIVPSQLSWISLIRGFPLWYQEKMRDQVSQEFLLSLS